VRGEYLLQGGSPVAAAGGMSGEASPGTGIIARYARSESLGTGVRQTKKLVIGLTGSFGTGKSTVAGFLKRFGAAVIDADKIAHQVLGRRSRVYRRIIRAFGRGILGGSGNIDRKKLAEIVFSDSRSLQKLNAITHPEIIRLIKKKLSSVKRGVVVLDAPLLLEAGLRNSADLLVVVKASQNTQVRRLQKEQFSKKDVLRRIKQQIPLKEKILTADFIIDNNGTLHETKKQVEELRRFLWKK
jgi:dephospho-CoA kinase